MRTLCRAALTATAIATLATQAVAQSQADAPRDAADDAGMRTGTMYDPVLNMNAYTLAYPTTWHFQGVLSQGTGCSPVPAPVYRVTSPDGLMVFEKMPPLTWSWGTAPGASTPKQGCLPLNEALSAKDFLKYLAALLKVEYVGEEPIPSQDLADFQQALAENNALWTNKYRSSGMQPPITTGEMASANVRFMNGTYVMQGQMIATVRCSTNHVPNYRNLPWENTRCNTDVQYVYAPKGQLQAVIAQAKHMRQTAIPEWGRAWQDNLDRQTRQNIAGIQRQTQQNIAAMRQYYADQTAIQTRQHNEFMATMQHGTDMSIQRANDAMNARSTSASDWVDYALDQQTVRDPNTGQLGKVASGSTYTWRNSGSNTAYQTNDPNANPNATQQGTWVRQQQVHGDGTP